MHLAKFSYFEAAYDAKLLDTKTKLRLVQRNKNSHMREKQVKPSPYIYMDCKSHSKLSGPVRADQCGWELCIGSAPVAYLPVRGVGGNRVTGGHFCHFVFRFL